MEHTEEFNEGFWRFIVEAFEFTHEELAAIDHQIPMTRELFDSCIDKCILLGVDKLFYDLLSEYPEFLEEYAKEIEEQIEDVELPERTPEQEAESWNRLCERIRKEFGDDAI